MDNELIELARLMYNDPYSEIAPDILPQLCDALEAAQAENARLREALEEIKRIHAQTWRYDSWQNSNQSQGHARHRPP